MVTAARGEPSSRKKFRTGVAISATELCAADIRLRGSAERAWRAPLDPAPTDGGSWPSLASAFSDLSRSLGVSGGALAVSLMPPLTEVRRLDLPPLRDDELQRLLSRNASRYFVNARGPQIVGALAAARRTRGAPGPVIAAAASARLVAAIRQAAQQSGWNVEVIAPAESAWAAGAIALWPAFARQNAWAAIAHDDHTDLLQLENGRLVGVRRFRAGGADAPMIADTVGPTARIGVAGPLAARKELSAALSAVGVIAVAPSGEWAATSERADLFAAHFAGNEIGPVLRAEDAVALDKIRARKTAWIIGGAAVALLAFAAFVELWGVHRQLRLVQEERARLRPQIASTLVGRTTVDATYRHLTALNAIERASPQWSSVLATLSEAVPDDAHLTAVRAREDSLIVDGLAQHAARVFDALEKTSVLVDVKAPAPVRRELQEDGTALDHFTIAARVARPTSGPATAPVSSPSPSGRRPGQ
jgi:Tfp pilus assembly protein PilN